MALCSLYQLRVQQVTSLRTLVFAQHFLVLSHEGNSFNYTYSCFIPGGKAAVAKAEAEKQADIFVLVISMHDLHVVCVVFARTLYT